MKKKIMSLVLIGLLLISGLVSANLSHEITPNTLLNWGDVLDQYQTEWNFDLLIGRFSENLSWNAHIAQSFTPSQPVITRVMLAVSKAPTTSRPLFAAIRDNLTGIDLTVVGVDPEDINESIDWVEFDFKDLAVTPGETYYLVTYTIPDLGNKYYGGWQYPENYPNGTAYWTHLPEEPYFDTEGDIGFKTYGRENHPPETPEQPDGPTQGIAGVEYTYATSASDPDGETLQFGWDWDGDDEVDKWTNIPTATNKWNTPGTYEVQVKARDEVGEMSNFSPSLTVVIIDETELEIQIPPTFLFKTVEIVNTGDYDAVDVVWSINITGGIIFGGDTQSEGEAEVIAAGDSIVVDLPQPFGLGVVDVEITVSAANADEVTDSPRGLLFIIFIFVLP